MGHTAGLEFVKGKIFLLLPRLEPRTMQAVPYSLYYSVGNLDVTTFVMRIIKFVVIKMYLAKFYFLSLVFICIYH